MQILHKHFRGCLMFVSIITLLAGCSDRGSDELALDQMEGKWELYEYSDDSRIFIEEWTRVNDTTFRGESYVINRETDERLNTEELAIRFESGNWQYVATPAGQKLTVFTLSELTPEHCRFVNPEHDFPKFIEYRWQTPDSMVAKVGDGNWNRQFNLARTK